MTRALRYLSVCSGIEAATVAWHPLGWRPVAFSEIDPFPSAVLAHHYPSVPNWGDMTRFEEWPDADVDVLVGGTPCQDYSVAGQRLGMAGSRGQLTLTYVEIAARYRPGWILWENVPGVLSSNGGRDFARLLGELSGQIIPVPDEGWKNSGIVSGIGDAYGLAWCVRDAQYVRTLRFSGAVPQRRRRVFLVGYLGDWRPAAAVLLVASSMRGDPPPRREPGQGAAPTLAARTRGGGGLGTDFDLDGGLIPEVANPLTARMHKGVNTTMDEGQTMVAQPIAFDCKSSEAKVDETGATPTLRAMGHAGSHANAGGQLAVAHALRGEGFDASEDGTGRGTPIVPVAVAFQDRFRGDDGRGYDRPPPVSEGVCGTLETVKPWQVAVAFDAQAGGNTGLAISEDVAGALHGGGRHGGRAAVATRWAVRRLTPRECSRLQAFPDDYLELVYADADEAHAAQILHVLWREAGAKGVEGQGWRNGKSAALLTPQILLAGVYVGWLSWSLARRCAAARGALPGENHHQEGFLRGLRFSEELGRSPHRRESFEQLAYELGCSVQELPLEAAQARAALRGSRLWPQAQKEWPLRYAFAAPEKSHRLERLNPDGPRYKALGNSMAVNAMEWLGERIALVDDLIGGS